MSAGPAFSHVVAMAHPALPSLDAPSSRGLEVARWAGKPARLARMDRLCAIALVACDQALLAAGLSPDDPSWAPERVGIVLGTAYGCHTTNEAYYRGYLGETGASPRLFAYTLPSSPVGEITIHHRILGPASTQVGGLGAALDALREAVRHLEAGRADRMLVAAADVSSPILSRLGGLATQDSASALVLHREAGGVRIRGSAARFVDRDPRAAAARCVSALRAAIPGGVDRLYAPLGLGEELARELQTSLVPLDEHQAASAPLGALRAFMTERVPSGIVLAADPSGAATAVALGHEHERRRSISRPVRA